MTGSSCLWHATPSELAQALRSAAGSVRRIHTFLIPPGMLGGFYSASFLDGSGVLHRFLLSYMQPRLLERELQPLRETIEVLGITEVDGRVEIGRNTGEFLVYFLPSVGEKDVVGTAENRRQRGYEDWLCAAREGGASAPVLSLPLPAEKQPVLCLSRGRTHCLFRLDGGGKRTLEEVQTLLGLRGAAYLLPEDPLCRDILGEWRE